MLDKLFGSPAAAKVLLYLQNYGDGTAPAIAAAMRLSERQVRHHLRRFQAGGLVHGQPIGVARSYRWRSDHPLTIEVRRLLQAALAAMPNDEYRAMFRERARPRRVERTGTG
jgi:hypothetical protein